MIRRFNTVSVNLFRQSRAYCDKKPEQPAAPVVEERIATSQGDYFRKQTPRQLEHILELFKLEQNAKLKEKEEQMKKIEESVKRKFNSKVTPPSSPSVNSSKK